MIEVGGVGLAVQCTPATLAGLRTGTDARLATSLVVREDSLTLFGFATDDERGVFETLQGVTGVGPRLAQAVLAAHSPDAVRAAVATDDVGALMLVSGVGAQGRASGSCSSSRTSSVRRRRPRPSCGYPAVTVPASGVISYVPR